ncbi:MAG: Hpt domain-containing protein [Magnetococcales bacterium]|nr:Hpt domain-containing protein [Magnetococcales bacterium]
MTGSKLYLTLALVALLTFCATAVVTYSVDRSKQTMEQAIVTTVPAMQLALRLAERVALLTASAAVADRFDHQRLDELMHDVDDGVALLQRYCTDVPTSVMLDRIRGDTAQWMVLVKGKHSTMAELNQRLSLANAISQTAYNLVAVLRGRLAGVEEGMRQHHAVSMALLITVCLSTLLLTGIIALLALRRSERDMLEQTSTQATVPPADSTEEEPLQPVTGGSSGGVVSHVVVGSSVSSLARIAADPTVTLPVVDPEILDRIRQLQRPGAANLLHRVLANYLEQTPRLLTELALAINRRDVSSTQHHLNGLKGSSSTIGASRLAEYCRSLEQTDGVPSEQEYHSIRALYQQVERLLLNLLQQDRVNA